MENQMFNNSHVLAWLEYFSDNTEVDLEHVKILDITRKNKNLIPTVEAHRSVLVFTEAGHPDIFYRMYKQKARYKLFGPYPPNQTEQGKYSRKICQKKQGIIFWKKVAK